MSINIGTLAGGIELNDALTSTLKQIDDRLTLAGVNFNQFSQKVQSANDVLGQAANVQITLQSELAKTQLLVAGHAKGLEDLAKISLTGAAAARQLAPQMEREAKALLMAKGESDALRQSMGLLNKEFNTVKETSQITTQQIVAFGRGLQETGIILSTVFTVPLVAAGAASLSFSTEFETAMTKVIATGGVAREEVEALRPAVLHTAEAVGISSSQIAVALDIIGSAAYRGAGAQAILTKSSEMAAIGMGTTEETARALVGAMKTFQTEHLSAAAASDILVKTVQLGNMHIDELVGSLARVNPVAAAMGVKFTDINATIATFTHLGAPADVAATGIRAILSTLLNDGAKTEKGLKALGISMSDLVTEMKEKGMAEALLHLVHAAGQTEEGLQKLSQVFPNIRALTTVLATAGAQEEDFLRISREIRGATGALDQAFDEVSKTWAFQWNQITVIMENFAIQMGDQFLPTLKEFGKVLKDDVLPAVGYLLQVFTELPTPVKDGLLLIGGALVTIGPGLILFGTAVRAIGHLATLGPMIAELAPSFVALAEGFTATAVGAGLLGTAMTAGVLAVVIPTLYELYRVGKELYGWWQDANKRLADEEAGKDTATANAARNIQILADASDYAKQPITDLATANHVLGMKFKEMRGEVEFVGPQLQEVGDKTKEVVKTTNDLAEIMKIDGELLKNSYEGLNASIKSLAERMFESGMSASEVFKRLHDGKLILSDQKVAVENLFDAWKEHRKTMDDVQKAEVAVAAAAMPLGEAQKKEVERLLALKVGHETIADALGIHIAQVNALVASKATEDKALKAELKAIDDLEKEWTKYYTERASLGASDTSKIVIKADADYQKIVDKLSDAGVAQVKYYNDAWKLRNMDIAKENEELLLKDTRTKSHMLNKLAIAREELTFMLDHREQFRAADIAAQREEIKGLQDMRDHWYDVGHAIDKNVEKVRTLSGEILTMKEYEARQLAGGSQDVTSQNFMEAIHNFSTSGGMNPFGTISETAALDLAKKGYSFAEIISILSRMNSGSMGPLPPPSGPKIPGFAQGGSGDFGSGTLAMLHGNEAIVPLGGRATGGITIEQGAFSFQYPIMNDRRSMTQFAEVIDNVLMERMRELGFQD